MKATPIDQLFAQTTINPQSVRKYLHTDPGYLRLCMDADPHMQTVGNHADYFEFHLRRYLMGGGKTLNRLFYEIRAFMAFDEPKARRLIGSIMHDTKVLLLQQEWYECMPRFDYARRQLKRQFLI